MSCTGKIVLFFSVILSLSRAFPTENISETPIETHEIPQDKLEPEVKIMHDEKTENPVKLWFDELAKNMTTNSESAIKDLQQWFSGLSGNSQSNNPFSSVLGGANNSPMMILGSYQALKVPMPGMNDIIKGMTNLAGAANNANQLFSNLPKLPGQQ